MSNRLPALMNDAEIDDLAYRFAEIQNPAGWSLERVAPDPATPTEIPA